MYLVFPKCCSCYLTQDFLIIITVASTCNVYILYEIQTQSLEQGDFQFMSITASTISIINNKKLTIYM